MRILVIGGSGYVGGLTLPYLKEHHELHVFDLKPPADSSLPFIEGSVTDPEALARAFAPGFDALLYMAMGSFEQDRGQTRVLAFDVNVKGVFLALAAAHDAGVSHAVYTSSLSIYGGKLEERGLRDEDVPGDARELYGFTKRLGEEACRNAWQKWGMDVNALRLCFPTPPEQWEEAIQKRSPLCTRADDVARALDAALGYRSGFQAFFISGDWQERHLSHARAKRFLGWEPLARPTET